MEILITSTFQCEWPPITNEEYPDRRREQLVRQTTPESKRRYPVRPFFIFSVDVGWQIRAQGLQELSTPIAPEKTPVKNIIFSWRNLILSFDLHFLKPKILLQTGQRRGVGRRGTKVAAICNHETQRSNSASSLRSVVDRASIEI